MAAATLSFLQSSPLKCNPARFPIQLPPPHKLPATPLRFVRTRDGFPRLGVSYCLPSKNSDLISTDRNENNPVKILVDKIFGALEALKKPALAAILLGLLLTCDVSSALAASGGRVGGSSFSSRRSSSSSGSYTTRSSSPGFSYSAPYYAPSPFGGGGVYVGPAVGVGVGAGSSFFLILMGFAAFILVSGFLSDRSEGSVLTAAEKTSVLKLQ
ncbi:hypothetical protein CRG98_034709, partial [Punica granatum]